MKIVVISGAIALVAVWMLVFRPESLGGPAGYIIVSGTSMQPAFYTDDVVVTRKQAEYSPGDVVAFRVPEGEAGAGRNVIHRVIGGNRTDGYITQGDNRRQEDPWRPTDSDVIGKQWLAIADGARYIDWIRSPLIIAGIALFIAFPEFGNAAAKTRHRAKGTAFLVRSR